MRDGWFYNEKGTPTGPLSIDALIGVIRKAADPRSVQVWNTGFKDWQFAKDVPQIAELIFRPPPISQNGPSLVTPAPETAPPPWEIAEQSRRRWLSFLIVLFIVLVVGAIYSSYIYNNSAQGIGSLFGELIGFGIIPLLFAIPARRATYAPAVVLAVAALWVGISNASKLIEGIESGNAVAAIRAEQGPHAIEQAVEKNPSNPALRLLGNVNEIAGQTNETVKRVSLEIEPPELSKQIDYSTASRAELQAYYSALKRAEANAKAAWPRYVALYKDERDQIEQMSRSTNISDDVRSSLLKGVDTRQGRFLNLARKMLPAQSELYGAIANYVAIIAAQYGNYNVQPNGQFVFRDQSVVPRFNDAANRLNVAGKKVQELEVERGQLVKYQREGWDRFVKGQ